MVQDAPGILGVAVHHVAKSTPEVLGCLRSSCGRRGREIAKLRLNHLGRIPTSLKLILAFVHGVRTFGTEELKRVIAQNIRIRQDLVVRKILLMLINGKFRIALDGISGAVSPRDGAVQHLLQV